jgi:uncharacterized SAM-binding protein YcdF (DUF218 family)
LYSLFKSLLLPPASLLLPLLLGLIWWRRPRLGRGLVWLGTLSLLVLSLPWVAARLMTPLEPYPALGAVELSQAQAQAILVLAANRAVEAGEYGGDDLGELTLERVRYGAWLQRRTGLPLYLSGSNPQDPPPTLARLMRRVAETEFHVPVAGIEERSSDTWENAHFSAELLAEAGVRRILLVTHAWHLPRAVLAFAGTGLEVIPAPTAFVHKAGAELEMGDFFPSARALQKSYYALHEYLGLVWYRIREYRA